MIATPQIVHLAAQPLAVIPLTVPRDRMMHVVGPALAELNATLAAQGLTATGPWFAHHHRMTPGIFDFEVCLPVAQEITPAGRVIPGIWPAGRVARTTYQGNYAQLHQAWGEFQDWIEAYLEASHCHQGIDLYERYLVNMGDTPNPAEWLTELNRPILG